MDSDTDYNKFLEETRAKMLRSKDLSGAVIGAAEKMEPELFRKLYPRVYNDLGSYYSPRLVAGFLTDAVASSKMMGIENIPQAHRLILPSIKYLTDRRMPYMFIAPDLVEAIKRTDFPDPIDWKEMAMPYENGIFMLPRGALTHPDDGDAVCIFYSRMGPGEWIPVEQHLPIFTTMKWSFSFLALCPKTAIWYDGNLTDDASPVVKLNNLFYATGQEYAAGPELPCPTSLDHKLNAVDSIFLEQVAVVLFGTMMAMNARPELSTPARLEKRIHKPGQTPKEFWSPNIIGKHYKLPTHDEGGAHASPRMHWRRGHFRAQAYGPKYTLRKTIWLEPQLIGSKGE